MRSPSDKPCGLMSDGPIKPFTGGWAKLPFVGSRVHFWEDTTNYWRSQRQLPEDFQALDALCGVVGEATDRAPALGAGNWPKCKKCQAKVDA